MRWRSPLALISTLFTLCVVCGLSACESTSSPASAGGAGGLSSLTPAERDERAAGDAVALRRLASTTNRLGLALAADTALFVRSRDVALSADERVRALTFFASVLDHCHALDAVVRFHLDFWRVNPLTQSSSHARHFDLGFLAYVEKLALALALIDQTINKPQFEKLLDEGSPVYGIPAGAYTRLKWNVVHVDDVGKSLAAHQYFGLLAAEHAKLRQHDAVWGFVQDRLEERYQLVKSTMMTRSAKLFGGNSVDIGVDLAHAAWFPVQAETAQWLGDTKVRRIHSMLITKAQVQEAIGRSEPGDIIVERRNWYLSNIGLPGFWPHAALWVGSPEELAAWSQAPEVVAFFKKPFTAYLSETYPDAWKAYTTPDAEGQPRRILEAVSEGVVFNPAEESIHADYVAAMRPRRSVLEKAKAIERAFSYCGRPYDFDFDFYTDSSLVCSELVFKSYEPRADVEGVTLGLEKVVGRMTLGPNSIVRTFDQQLGTPQEQLSFVWFLDGRETAHTAAFADVDAFRASWRRPKWDIVQR
jgi:hypothetical protein